MAKKNKNQKKQIRDKALKDLEGVKSKLNIRTYNSMKKSIINSNIDKVERLNEEIKNLTHKPLSKLTKNLVKDIVKVEKFNKSGNDTTIKKLNPSKLKSILKSIDLSVNKRAILSAGNRHYTLSAETIQKFIKNVDNFWVDENEIAAEGGSDAELIQDVKEINEITLSKPKWLGKNVNEGAFWKYYNNINFDLSEFDIYDVKQKNYEDNCFIVALRAFDVDEEIITNVKIIMKGMYLKTKDLKDIVKNNDIYITIRKLNDKNLFHYGNKSHKRIELGLIDNHYFAIKKVKFTSYSLKNYFELCDKEDFNKIYSKGGDKDEKRYTNSWEAIKYMYENKEIYFRDIPPEDILDTQYYKETKVVNASDVKKSNIKENKKPLDTEKDKNKIVFFDFETTTNEKIHKPYLVCNSETEAEYGEECGLYMLRKLYNKFYKDYNSITLIAHNAGYDFRFIQQHLSIRNIIERGHNLLSAEAIFTPYKGKFIKIIIKDSYSVITMPLRKFGKCFNLTIEKDILPYSLYNSQNIKKRYFAIEDIKPYCDHQVRCNILDRKILKNDYDLYFDLFIENCKKNKLYNEVGEIDILEYSKIYCEKDVEVLREGYNKFGELLQNSCNMNIEDFMSSAQLAHTYMLKEGVFDDVNKVSSIPKEFIMKCMVGGRTMCAKNEKNHIKEVVDDFDAVSLYPSAMRELGGYLKGEPKMIEDCNKNYEFLKEQDGYFIQIKVNKVNKHFRFPLMSYINDDGVRIFTNEPPENLYVCKIDLEELITHHKIEFDIIDGYYYDEGRNYKLKEVIEFAFNERLKMKNQITIKNTGEVIDFEISEIDAGMVKLKEQELKSKNIEYEKGNPLQEIWKLIMNSSYGKTLQKAVPEKTIIKRDDDIEKFIDKNYNSITYYEEIYGTGEIKTYKIKQTVGVEDHFNNCPAGVEVLAMSKRIMNRVMCLAEDNGLDIYYQDTDSMHIKTCDIKPLSQLFEEKYGSVLIGKGMGQFHSDFDSGVLKGDIHAVESIFLGKKCYIDKLKGDEEGVYDYHIRMKGVSNASIKYKSNCESVSYMDIYKSLMDGNDGKFDLTCGGLKINFDFKSDYTISTKEAFIRTLKFK
jgi:hypothetical protein